MVTSRCIYRFIARSVPIFLDRLLRRAWSSQSLGDKHDARVLHSVSDRLLRNDQPKPAVEAPTTTTAAMEHLYERVRLVRGRGDVSKGQLCIMSFVALLAGERHTDAPATASSFIRHFAIALNDALPEADRQCLKLFAARILGTNDGLDAERARVASRIIAEEVDPRFRTDLAGASLTFHPHTIQSAPDRKGTESPGAFVQVSLPNCGLAWASCDPNVIADYVAKYLISCALTVPHTDASSWYWSKAIDLLDRLCEIGPSEPRSGLDSAQVECAEAKLSQCVRPSIIAQIIAGGDLVVR
jgi:hypothetical protein